MTFKIPENAIFHVLDQINEAIYIIDRNGMITYVNRGAEDLEHLDKNDMIGKSVSEVYRYTELREEKNAPSLNVLRTGIPQIDENVEWYTSEGVSVNAITSSYPLFENDELVGVFSISENIEKQKERLRSVGAFDRKDTYRLRKKLMRNGTIYIFDDIIGKSETIQEAIAMAKRFAVKKMPVMIYGETGTGKEMFAQSIHNASPYMAGNFVAVNCAAIPENLLESTLFGTVKGAFTGAIDSPGLFEKAENGSIFLDEINSMPISLQAKLLRALQEKEVRRIGNTKTRKINCRVISATNKNPSQAIANGEMREDLFYRLSTGLIFIPPLRERGRDLELLMSNFIEAANAELNTEIQRASAAFISLLRAYPWPGNIRELSNTIESSMNMTKEGEFILDVYHLPSYLKYHFKREIASMPPEDSAAFADSDSGSLWDTYPVVDFQSSLSNMVGQYEKNILEIALAGTGGNLTKCSSKLGISRQGLAKKVKKYNIDLNHMKRRFQK
ncbi:MAG: sigma 54-interacting transcriptional regulator [Bacillota bacterium]|nr:sigma 54-interacting transcriptional regulator [Bacillota bacterium]